MNKRAFAWGRLAANDPEKVQNAVRPVLPVKSKAKTCKELIAERVAFLTGYQDSSYAKRYSAFMAEVLDTEAEGGRSDGLCRGRGGQSVQADGVPG
jgi:indolepyruvate ferredoxin oxidoreductase